MNCLVKILSLVTFASYVTAHAAPMRSSQLTVASESLFAGSYNIAHRTVLTGREPSRANAVSTQKNKSDIKPEEESNSTLRGEPLRGEKNQKIFHTDQCGGLSRGGFIWFTDKIAFKDWLTPLGAQGEDVLLNIDFKKQGVLLVDFGVAATPGAGTEAVGDRLVLEGDTAFFTVKQQTNQPFGHKPFGNKPLGDKPLGNEPLGKKPLVKKPLVKPGIKRRVQVITHPCTLFSMPRHGYDVLVIQNEWGDQLASIQNR